MTFDNVERPKHYADKEFEVIDYIKDTLTADGFEGYCIGNVIKYVSRYRKKGGLEDLQMALYYLSEADKTLRDSDMMDFEKFYKDFYNEELDLDSDKFNVVNVSGDDRDMNGMFSAQYLIGDGDMERMFEGLEADNTLDLGQFSTERTDNIKVEDMFGDDFDAVLEDPAVIADEEEDMVELSSYHTNQSHQDAFIKTLSTRQLEFRDWYKNLGVISITDQHVHLTHSFFTELFGDDFSVENRKYNNGETLKLVHITDDDVKFISLLEVE